MARQAIEHVSRTEAVFVELFTLANGKKADVTNRVRVPHDMVPGGHRVMGRADARAHRAAQQRRVPAVFRRGGSVMTLYICAVLPVLTAAMTIRRWSRG